MKGDLKEAIQSILTVTSQGTWVGRCYVPSNLAYNGIAGPHVVQVSKGRVLDLSSYFGSTGDLINTKEPVTELTSLKDLPDLGGLEQILLNSVFNAKKKDVPWLIAPNDVQAIKACGVTFIESLLERVIEEKAKGNPSESAKIRQLISDKIGADLTGIVPGSENAMQLKKELQEQGMWSQYLEVGIGKDAEVFTKAQPFSAVGFGAEVGILKDSNWNNPEPEIVLLVSNDGEIIGATLGNDVNLRDFEGRSALLLGEAKDQNGSCAIGPLFRLFDDTFSLKTIKEEKVNLRIQGDDGFHLEASSHMSKISRSPEKLVAQTIGENHQYPDGLVLFCGTMFAPIQDRDLPDNGFTHKLGDEVSISSEHLGSLINWVNHCHNLPKWNFGIGAFVAYIVKRNSL